MRRLIFVPGVVYFMFFVTTVSANPLAKASGSACSGGKCAVPVEVRVEKTKAVVKAVAVRTEEAAEKVGKGRLKELLKKLIHRRGK